MLKPSKEFMLAAIEEGRKSAAAGDYAVGAVVVKDSNIISRAGSRVKTDNDPVHHAEVVAIRLAAKTLGNRHLDSCVLYTTHEPCPMCASAAVWAKMKGIVCGTRMKDRRDFRIMSGSRMFSWRTINVPAAEILQAGEPKLFIVEEFMRDECRKLFPLSK